MTREIKPLDFGYSCPEAFIYDGSLPVYCNIRGLALGKMKQHCDCRDYEICSIYMRMDMFIHLSEEDRKAWLKDGGFKRY